MAAKARGRREAYNTNNMHAIIMRNQYFYPRRLAFQTLEESCEGEAEKCYEVKPDGNSGRWLCFHIGDLSECEHEHHKDEVWVGLGQVVDSTL
jgi:hypothetical protein